MTRFRALCAPVLAASAMLAAGCGGSSYGTSSGSSSSGSASGAGSASANSSYAPASGSYSYGPSSASTGATAGGSAVSVTTKHSSLGTILAAGPKQLTVYLFEGDTGTGSSCNGACAQAWPPVLGKPSASGAASSGDLGTIKRSDGSTQATYKGHPLYYFVRDQTGSDSFGQGLKSFGAGWYVLSPAGSKIDNS